MRISDDPDRLQEIGESVLRLGSREDLDSAEVFVARNQGSVLKFASPSCLEYSGFDATGVGIRVAVRGGLGFSSTTDLSEAGTRRAIRSARSGARQRRLPSGFALQGPSRPTFVPGLYDARDFPPNPERLAALTERMISRVTARPSCGRRCVGMLSQTAFDYSILNTTGLRMQSKGSIYEATLNVHIPGGVEGEGRGVTSGRRLSDFDADRFVDSAVANAADAPRAREPPGSVGEVVLGHQATACLTALCATLSSPVLGRNNSSPFLNLVGKRVAGRSFSLVDDPTLVGGVGSSPFDDEGVPSSRRLLINEGVLVGLPVDHYYQALQGGGVLGCAYRMQVSGGTAVTSGKRFDFEPTPFPMNPLIPPGEVSDEEIAESVRDGVLLDNLHYPRLLNPIDGTFSCTLRGGNYRIQGGKVRHPLRAARLTGNFYALLRGVSEVSRSSHVSGVWGMGSYHTPMVRARWSIHLS